MTSLPSEDELEALCELTAAELEALVPEERFGGFHRQLLPKILRRHAPWREALEEAEEGSPPPSLEGLEGGVRGVAQSLARELAKACGSPYFRLAKQVFLRREDDAAFRSLWELLESQLPVARIVRRYRLDPEHELPALQSRIWEAIAKWDGRDFRAYCARIVRNHCLDRVTARRPAPLEEDPGEGSRPAAPSVAQRDALDYVLSVIDELEAAGRIGALDGVLMSLVGQGRSVADIVHGLRSSDVPHRFQRVCERVGSPLESEDALALRLLLDGLTPTEAATVSGRDEAVLAELAELLGAPLGTEAWALARAFARPGLRVRDLERAQRLTTNAINLCLNRVRLKVWMGLVDRAYETLRRRGVIDEFELAVVAERCAHAPPAGCRMYKDLTCKRGLAPVEVARRSGLDLDARRAEGVMQGLRAKLLEQGLGPGFPDYNACLVERKPLRRGRTRS